MGQASAIGPAQDALTAGLAARALIVADKVPVGLGEPQTPRREQIWVSLRPEAWSQEWETTGATATATREERFELSVFFMARRAGDTAAAPRDRVLALIDELRAMLRADESLGGAVFQSEWALAELAEAPIDNAMWVTARVRVRCLAYLA